MIPFLIISTIVIFIAASFFFYDDWQPIQGPAMGLGIAFLYAVIVGVIMIGIYQSKVEAKCYAAGYPDSRITWDFTAYCVKRVDQTDIVVPLEEVTRGH